MKYNKIYVDPVTAEQINNLTKNRYCEELIWVGTEHIYLHPSIKKLELDLGGDRNFVIK